MDMLMEKEAPQSGVSIDSQGFLDRLKEVGNDDIKLVRHTEKLNRKGEHLFFKKKYEAVDQRGIHTCFYTRQKPGEQELLETVSIFGYRPTLHDDDGSSGITRSMVANAQWIPNPRYWNGNKLKSGPIKDAIEKLLVVNPGVQVRKIG